MVLAPMDAPCVISNGLATMKASELMADLSVISNGLATMKASELMADLNRGFAR